MGKQGGGPADTARQRYPAGIERESIYPLEEARALRDRYKGRRLPTLSVRVFNHEPGNIVLNRKAAMSALIVVVDGTPCGEFDGHWRTASQKGCEKQDDEGKQGDHGPVGLRESTSQLL